MIRLEEELRKLGSVLSEFREATVASALEPELYLRGLSRTIVELEAKIENTAPPKPPLDPEEVWAKWRNQIFDLTKLDSRESRTLCVSPLTAMKPRLIEALDAYPDPLERWITFHGFVQVYFALWRTMEKPGAAEGMILHMLRGNRIPRQVRTLTVWRKSTFLFSDQAAQRLGEIMVRDHSSIKQVCTDHMIDQASALARCVHEAASENAAKGFLNRESSMSETDACRELKWMAENLLTQPLAPDVYRHALGTLVLSKSASSMPRLQKMMVDIIQNDPRLGDPRLPGNAKNWRTVSAESKERYLAWLAKETLQFFFDTLVPVNDDNRRRADFWLKYANKQGKIKDFQVAVSEEDRPKIRASRAKTIPAYSSINGGHTSAFLMVFEGYGQEYVVIEFSEGGNAAYIYERKKFESSGARLRSNSFDLSSDLKRQRDAADRIIHRDGNLKWESNASIKMASLGIRP